MVAAAARQRQPSACPLYAGFSAKSAAQALGVSRFSSLGLASGSRLSTSRRYANGSMPASSQLATMLKNTAAAWAPPSDPANSQFFRPTTN